MIFQQQDQTYRFLRHPAHGNRSLRAWNAADELLISRLEGDDLSDDEAVAIWHDRFGFLTTLLHARRPNCILTHKSQQKGCLKNLIGNQADIEDIHFSSPLTTLPPFNLAIVKVPKSQDLFRLYLHQIARSIQTDGMVLCGFMTRHFSPQLLQIAGEYFEEVTQSKARKKARLLELKKKKPLPDHQLLHEIPFKAFTFQQYHGVFSAGHIDYATQFLIDYLDIHPTDQRILDLGSGNGVIAHAVHQQQAQADIHLQDDAWLAIESSKLNLTGPNFHFHFEDDLAHFEDTSFDLVVSNPPFHFEYEIDIELPLMLFKEVYRILKRGGRFVLVANRHLNYKVHLEKQFRRVEIVAMNNRFVVLEVEK